MESVDSEVLGVVVVDLKLVDQVGVWSWYAIFPRILSECREAVREFRLTAQSSDGVQDWCSGAAAGLVPGTLGNSSPADPALRRRTEWAGPGAEPEDQAGDDDGLPRLGVRQLLQGTVVSLYARLLRLHDLQLNPNFPHDIFLIFVFVRLEVLNKQIRTL